MMNKTITNFSKIGLALAVGATLLSACTKDRGMIVERLPKETVGVYVLNEGSFGTANNSSITYYNIATKSTTTDFFRQQNGIPLGTNANELKQYGSKMYCVITGTNPAAKDSYVEVIDIATGKSVKRIQFFDATKGFMPRSVGFYQGKAYVSGYDGFISKIDTASLNIDSRVLVGGALEGVAIVNGKLYVANSVHINYPSANNNSISVVDLTSFQKLKDIIVNLNPTKVAATATGEVYAITNGSYLPYVAPTFERLHAMTDTKTQTYDYSLGGISINGGKGLVIAYGQSTAIKVFNLTSGVIGDNFITDNTAITSLYEITVDPLTDDVFVADAVNYAADGKLIAFTSEGKQKFEIKTGVVPKSAVFNYRYK
jgi:hypothetical protein